MTARVSSLFIYPVKGCRGVEVGEAVVTHQGFAGDRELMVVDADGCLVTQRENRRLASISAHREEDRLRLAASGRGEVSIRVRDSGPGRMVTIWSDACRAIDQGDEVAGWLEGVLGETCRLVGKPHDEVRQVDPRYALDALSQVSFADGFPYLLVSEESLADLNRRLDTPLPMNRFRPSIVVAGWDQPFTEDAVRRLAIGDIEMELVKPCGRCVVTTIDQATLEAGQEPLRTLAMYHRHEDKATFGQNGIPRTLGRIRRGDRVEILAVKEGRELGPG